MASAVTIWRRLRASISSRKLSRRRVRLANEYEILKDVRVPSIRAVFGMTSFGGKPALELEYVLKADPDLARAHYLLGMALYNSGRADEGRPHLERFIELAPEDPDVEIAKGLLSYQP